MSDSTLPLKRDGTMQVTAKEGIEYLEASGEDTLLKLQGLKEDKAPVERQGTMAATAEEGEALLADSGIDPDAQTRGQQKELDEVKEAQKHKLNQQHKLSREGTMAETAKEGEQLLADANLDADAHTRGQQRTLDSLKEDEPVEKKARLSKEGTMVETAKEGAEIVGNECLGETRSETKEIADSTKSSPTKDGESQKGGRQTRSRSGDKCEAAPLKRDGTMQQTLKEGEEFLSRDDDGDKEGE